MGVSSSKSPASSKPPAPPSKALLPAVPPTAPSTDRETTPLAEKEAAAEFQFMLDNMRMKQWAAEDENLRDTLRREDNRAFKDTYVPHTLPLDVPELS